MKLVNVYILFSAIVFFIAGIQKASAQFWSLQQCIDTAQVHNKNLQMGRNTMAISQERQSEAKANLIPKITANADYKYFTNLPYQLMPLSTFNPMAPEGQFKEAQFGVPHNINANVQLMMPIYNPQLYGAIQTTKIAAEIAELQYKKTEEQVLFEISNLYYNGQILHHQLAFIDSNLFNAERLLKNIELLKEQLLAKGTDVSKIKLQVSQLNLQKETVSAKYNQILNTLKFLMGIPLEQKFEIDTQIKLESVAEYAVATTVEIRMIKTQKNILSSELNTLNNSRYFPSLNLFGSFGTTGFGYDKEPNTFLKIYPIGFAGIQLSYPIFNGTVTQRKINQKKFELHNADLQVEVLTEQNKLQIENATLQREISKKSVEMTTEQINLAQAIYIQTELQQKQGIASLTDLLLADNALRESQQNYLTAIIDFFKADLELKKLTGHLTSK